MLRYYMNRDRHAMDCGICSERPKRMETVARPELLVPLRTAGSILHGRHCARWKKWELLVIPVILGSDDSCSFVKHLSSYAMCRKPEKKKVIASPENGVHLWRIRRL
jgi:hypothetical protein